MDLKVARRKLGLTQADCAHLLGVHRSKISHLERGEIEPSLREVCMLALIHGRSVEDIFGCVFHDLHGDMEERLTAMPAARGNWIGRFNRARTLERLASQLAALASSGRDGV